MRTRSLAAFVVSLLLAACGGQDASIPDAEIAPLAWERAYGPEDMTAWREGVAKRLVQSPTVGEGDFVPAEGVEIELLAPRPGGRPPFEVVATARSGPDGSFRVGPGPADAWAIRARLDGHAPSMGGFGIPIDGMRTLPLGRLDVRLRPACPFDVQVVDAAGSPVSGITLLASGDAYVQHVTTDAGGRAHFVGPPGGVLLQSAVPDRELTPRWVELPRESGAADVELRAPALPPATGRVIDARTGAAIEGAVVLSVDDPEIRTRTDADGHFTLAVGEKGRVAAFGRGYGWRSEWATKLVDGAELRLEPGLPVSGRVVGPDGAPVAGARVLVAALVPGYTERIWGPRTADDGTFTMDWVPAPPPGAPAPTLAAHRRGLGWSSGVEVESPDADSGNSSAPGETRFVELNLAGERAVSGIVQRASGAVEGNVPIEIELEYDGLSMKQSSVLGMQFLVQAIAGADGNYEVPGLPANAKGTVRFDVAGARFARDLEPAAQDAEVSLTLTASKEISGRVVDVAGDPITIGGEVLVDLMNHREYSSMVRHTSLEPDGTFRFRDLPEGIFGVRATVTGFDVSGAVVTLVGEGNADNVVLVAEVPAPLDFEVSFPQGVEPGPVTIELYDADDPAARTRTERIPAGAEELRVSMPLVRHGRYHIIASSGVYWVRHYFVDIPDGFRDPFRLELEKTAKVTMRVVDADGRPRVGARVRVARVGAQGEITETFRTEEGGVATVTGLLPGETYRFHLAENGLPLAGTVVEVAAGEPGTTDAELRLAPFGDLAVILDPALREGGACVIELRGAGGRPSFVDAPGVYEKVARHRVASTGDLVFRAVEAGPTTVIVTRDGRELARRTVDVRAGERTPVRISR